VFKLACAPAPVLRRADLHFIRCGWRRWRGTGWWWPRHRRPGCTPAPRPRNDWRYPCQCPWYGDTHAVCIVVIVIAGGPARVRLHCRFRNRRTESLHKAGMKWLGGRTTRRCDRTLCPARAGPAPVLGRQELCEPARAEGARHRGHHPSPRIRVVSITCKPIGGSCGLA
jgi:hypothetical protein